MFGPHHVSFTPIKNLQIYSVSYIQDIFWLHGKESGCNIRAIADQTRIPSLGQKDPSQESMATYFSVLAWGILKARGDWWAYSSSGGNELETTEQLISIRDTFLTETLKIPEMQEKILSLDKVKENAQTVELNYFKKQTLDMNYYIFRQSNISQQCCKQSVPHKGEGKF